MLSTLNSYASKMGFTDFRGSSVPQGSVPTNAREIRFAVPFSIEQLEAGEADFQETFSYVFHTGITSHNNDALEVHGYKLMELTESVTAVAIILSMSMTRERTNLCEFIKDLNALQSKYNVTVMPDTPLLHIHTGREGASYDLMKHEAGKPEASISRIWGG